MTLVRPFAMRLGLIAALMLISEEPAVLVDPPEVTQGLHELCLGLQRLDDLLRREYPKECRGTPSNCRLVETMGQCNPRLYSERAN